jgi:hypothetical protein
MTPHQILLAHFKTAIEQGGNPEELVQELLVALNNFGFEIRRMG